MIKWLNWPPDYDKRVTVLGENWDTVCLWTKLRLLIDKTQVLDILLKWIEWWCRMLPSSHLFVSMCLFARVRCSLWERLIELCAISACAHLLCTIKTILTKYDRSAVFRQIHPTLSTVVLTDSICRIIPQSEFKIHFSALQRPFPWQHFTVKKLAL